MKKESVFKIITPNEQVEKEAATRADILHFYGRGTFFLGKNQGILKRNVCGNSVNSSFGVFCSEVSRFSAFFLFN